MRGGKYQVSEVGGVCLRGGKYQVSEVGGVCIRGGCVKRLRCVGVYWRGEALGIVRERECQEVKERKKAVLTRTKMKAEAFGIEVKFKSLKAQQAALEAEEDKRNSFLSRTESEEERRKLRILEQEKKYLQNVRQHQNKWSQKIDKIRERERLVRQRCERKLIQFELESQDKDKASEMEAQDKVSEMDILRPG
ncbi:hypothetical protein PoB_000409400 [Plakobranchus ocellatus]|uniref:Uncharacterized protein n=1 Tax=Plakobranchus ocellatus TaxID=259542 RepID=A0AAV3Y675_9GAST|nr:hypothetical protein PoB_000409400 [Plakobranchus ocellatus]